MATKVLSGQKFNSLTILDRAPNQSNSFMVWCVCDCGNKKRIEQRMVALGKTKDCGCVRKEVGRKWRILKKSKEYRAWAAIIARCLDKNCLPYKSYGARGISICPEWRNDFNEFYKSMGKSPSPKHSIDRIDNNGNYEPGNCRWATKIEQNNNTGKNIYIEYNGEKMTMAELCFRLKLRYVTFKSFYRVLGWSLEDSIKRTLELYPNYNPNPRGASLRA